MSRRRSRPFSVFSTFLKSAFTSLCCFLSRSVAFIDAPPALSPSKSVAVHLGEMEGASRGALHRPTIAVEERPSMATAKLFDLTGKVALITGGNSGIGLGMADGLAASGAAVCIWGTREDKNTAAAEQLRKHGGRVLAMRCDVSDEAAVERGFAETVGALGRVDACFVNAGVAGRRGVASFMEMTTEDWRRVLSVNLDGAFFTLRAAARHMVDRPGGGSLVVTSSLAALSGQARGEHYAASKGGVISMMKALSVELA